MIHLYNLLFRTWAFRTEMCADGLVFSSKLLLLLEDLRAPLLSVGGVKYRTEYLFYCYKIQYKYTGSTVYAMQL